ncbi:hypothetical protein H4219_005215 [Mycoemilia scoparia]|uniref:Uncharacterized protein n=1 Tax=Mycoemilia scoparia TaxID=417184 RepID=A0A9W7ZUT3_9FUNG|nr:hypothetical protein H4219_005215 [Mycoemilia scoparia]
MATPSEFSPDLLKKIAEFLAYNKDFAAIHNLKQAFPPPITDLIDSSVLIKLTEQYNEQTGQYRLIYQGSQSAVQRILETCPTYNQLSGIFDGIEYFHDNDNDNDNDSHHNNNDNSDGICSVYYIKCNNQVRGLVIHANYSQPAVHLPYKLISLLGSTLYKLDAHIEASIGDFYHFLYRLPVLREMKIYHIEMDHMDNPCFHDHHHKESYQNGNGHGHGGSPASFNSGTTTPSPPPTPYLRRRASTIVPFAFRSNWSHGLKSLEIMSTCRNEYFEPEHPEDDEIDGIRIVPFNNHTFPQLNKLKIKNHCDLGPDYTVPWFSSESRYWMTIKNLSIVPISVDEMRHISRCCPLLEDATFRIIMDDDNTHKCLDIIFDSFRYLKALCLTNPFPYSDALLPFDPTELDNIKIILTCFGENTETDSQIQKALGGKPTYAADNNAHSCLEHIVENVKFREFEWNRVTSLDFGGIVFPLLVLIPLSKLVELEYLKLRLYSLDTIDVIKRHFEFSDDPDPLHNKSKRPTTTTTTDGHFRLKKFENVKKLEVSFLVNPSTADSVEISSLTGLFPNADNIRISL